MANLFSKLLDYIGIEEPEDELIQEHDEIETEYQSRTDNVVNINRAKRKYLDEGAAIAQATSQMKMIVYYPISYEDTQNIIDNLKSRKPVIVNMEELEVDSAQRILDFMAGAVYALNGTIYKIARGIFVVAPHNYDIIGSGEESSLDGLV